MNYLSFETDKFNRTEVREHYLNPSCFGDDLAEWLSQQLIKNQVDVQRVHQEDWGWEVALTYNNISYFLSVGNVAGNGDGDYGEWRIYFTRQCSLIGRIFGQDKMSKDDAILSITQAILNKAKFKNIHCQLES